MSGAKPGNLRVVLDTNIYFSAFVYPKGLPFRVWQAAIRNQYQLLVSPAIVREVADVLRTRANWQESKLIDSVKLLAKVAEIITPKLALQVITDDPDDDRILECAVAGRADLIVSGDRHLIRLKSFEGIGIVRPVEFQRILGT